MSEIYAIPLAIGFVVGMAGLLIVVIAVGAWLIAGVWRGGDD